LFRFAIQKDGDKGVGFYVYQSPTRMLGVKAENDGAQALQPV